MGKRGPAKTPTKLTILRGNPGKRPINKNEPKYEDDGVRCPSWLDPIARKEWKRIVPSLKKNGLLTNVDVSELARYCKFHSEYLKAIEFLDKNGLVYPRHDDSGRVTGLAKYPHVNISHEAAMMCHRIAGKFGFTPSDRTGLTVTEQQEDDPFQKFLNRKPGGGMK